MRGNVLGFGCEEQYFSREGHSRRKVNYVNSSHERDMGKITSYYGTVTCSCFENGCKQGARVTHFNFVGVLVQTFVTRYHRVSSL